MNFESLPNEIFLDLFDYFDGTNLFYAFYRLNYRFSHLLCKQYRTFHFKFKSISKHKFDIICEQYLPFITDQVITLSLSNGDDTPQQIDLFFSYISSINQFTHLRSLSLFNFRTYKIIMKIIDQCHELRHFTRLKFKTCSFTSSHRHFQSIVNNIWSLPKLIHFECDVICIVRPGFSAAVKISSSLQRLSLVQRRTTLNQINQLFEYTPHLKHLSIIVKHLIDSDYLPSSFPTLINLNIHVSNVFDMSQIIYLLQNIPNLRRLNINLKSNLIDGYKWEQIIDNYLPNLKIFQFQMQHILDFNQNIQEKLTELIHPFRSSFWIDKHRWFVRCFTCQTTIYLYTLSNTLQYWLDKPPDSFISTHTDDNLQKFCHDIIRISYETEFDYPIPSYIRLTNIKHLRIELPINDQFWFIIPNLNQLHSLTILKNIDTFQSQFQALLDRAPNLYRLTIEEYESLPSQISLFKYMHASIRQLNLETYGHYFNEENCMELIRSSLCIQCEQLSINVTSPECILCLVKNMINLRFLNVQLNHEISRKRLLSNEDDEQSQNRTISYEDKLIQWLKERLPSTYLITRHPGYANKIHIWI